VCYPPGTPCNVPGGKGASVNLRELVYDNVRDLRLHRVSTVEKFEANLHTSQTYIHRTDRTNFYQRWFCPYKIISVSSATSVRHSYSLYVLTFGPSSLRAARVITLPSTIVQKPNRFSNTNLGFIFQRYHKIITSRVHNRSCDCFWYTLKLSLT